MRLAQRLLLGTALVVGFVATVIVALVDRQLRARLEADAAATLAREARLVGEDWILAPGDPDALADRIGRALGRRVTLVAPDGRVLGDSHFDGLAIAALEPHGTRPEIREALAGADGRDRRLSASTARDELYVAVPVEGRGVARVSQPTAGLDATVAAARRDIVRGALIALLAALALAWLFARSVSRPVEELRDVAEAIAAGDLTARPTLEGPGEVDALARALRRLAEQLAARLDALAADDARLRELFESRHEGVLEVDGEGRVVRMNETARRLLGVRDPLPFAADLLPRAPALREATLTALRGEAFPGAEATVADRTLMVVARPLADGGAVLSLLDLTRLRRLEAVRRDFVANVSHELRTPLTVIGGFAETLTARDIPEADRLRFAERIAANTRRMLRLVDDLLDLSRIEGGGWVPAPEPLALRSVAQEVLAGAQERAHAKGVRLEVAIAADAERVHADPTALRQVLANLVDNAVRHTAAGSVTIEGRANAEGIEVAVRDTGAGIPEAHLPRIFERFYRADPARSRDQGGTGLGLAIVRHLVDAHGGHVRAESTVGRGTTVTALFPAPKA